DFEGVGRDRRQTTPGELRRRRVAFAGALATGMVGVFLVAYGTGLWARNAPMLSPRETPSNPKDETETSQLVQPPESAELLPAASSAFVPAPPTTGVAGDASDPAKKRPLKPKKRGRL